MFHKYFERFFQYKEHICVGFFYVIRKQHIQATESVKISLYIVVMNSFCNLKFNGRKNTLLTKSNRSKLRAKMP